MTPTPPEQPADEGTGDPLGANLPGGAGFGAVGLGRRAGRAWIRSVERHRGVKAAALEADLSEDSNLRPSGREPDELTDCSYRDDARFTALLRRMNLAE